MYKWLTKAIAGTFASGLTVADPALARFAAGIGGQSSTSGKTVTVDSVLQLSAVWACVGLISQTIATLPFVAYTRTKNGGRKVAFDHPLYALLHDQPNADMTSVEFWEAIISCVLLWGNGYAIKSFNGNGDVIALTLMQPERVMLRRLKDGAIRYYFTPYQGAPEEFTEEQIFHLKGWSTTGMLGLSPVSYARNSMGTAIAADEAAAKFFANGMSSNGFIETGGAILTDKQRAQFKAALAEYRGSTNTGKMMLLEGGFKFHELSMHPDDAQLLATREFSVDEICRWYRVPAWMIGHMAKSTSWGTGLEQQMIGFSTFTLRPWLSRIEQRVKMSLIKPEERSKLFAEFNLRGLLRGDSAARAALYSTAVQNGLSSRDELRELENDPAIEGGDIFTVQSNLVRLQDVGVVPPTQTAADFGLPPKPQDTGASQPGKQ